MDVIGAMNELRGLVGTVTGFNTVYLGVPEIPPDDDKLPAAMVRINPEDPGTIDLGNMEITVAKIRIDTLLRRVGDRAKEEEFTLGFLPEIVGALRSNITLGGYGVILPDITWNIGHLILFQYTYFGSSIALQIQDMEDVAGLISG